MNKERPVLKDLIKENMSETEMFQNKTLRPIIKMQHNLLVASFNEYLKGKKIDLSTISVAQSNEKVKTIFLKDNLYKNFIVGCVVGHFSMEEFEFYLNNTSEVKRRILKITAQRIQK